MNDAHLVLHGLAIKKHGSAQAVADLLGMDPGRVGAVLADLVRRGRVAETDGKFMLRPASYPVRARRSGSARRGWRFPPRRKGTG